MVTYMVTVEYVCHSMLRPHDVHVVVTDVPGVGTGMGPPTWTQLDSHWDGVPDDIQALIMEFVLHLMFRERFSLHVLSHLIRVTRHFRRALDCSSPAYPIRRWGLIGMSYRHPIVHESYGLLKGGSTPAA